MINAVREKGISSLRVEEGLGSRKEAMHRQLIGLLPIGRDLKSNYDPDGQDELSDILMDVSERLS